MKKNIVIDISPTSLAKLWVSAEGQNAASQSNCRIL